MRLSAKTEYACRAVFELAQYWPNTQPLKIPEIAQQQQIPENFLTQIMIELKQVGIVNSIRGKNGGYLLAKPPKQITLLDVMSRFENNLNEKIDDKGPLSFIWKEIHAKTITLYRETSFEKIIEQQQQHAQVVNFHI